MAEFIKLSKDGEWGKGEPFDDSVQMRVIRGTDFDSVRSGDWSRVPTRYVSRKHAELKALQDGDLLIETAGGSPGRPTGRTIFLRRGSISGQNVPVTCASFARFIRLDPALVEPEFVFWWLQHQYATEQLLAFHTQHTGVARFQWTTCSHSIVVPQVERPIQRRIAAILSAYDDLIENNNRRIKILEEMAQRIYREWFVDFRYPGHEDVPLVDSELGVIPEGWSVCRLDEVADVARGLSWDREEEVTTGGHPVVTIPNVQRRLRLDGMTRLDRLTEAVVEKYSLNDGDTLLVGSNGNPERVGHAVSVPRGVEVLFASFLMRVRSDNTLLGSALLHFQLKDPRLTSAWRSSAIGSTSLRNIRLSTLRASPVLIPPSGIRADGDAQLREYLDYKDALDRQATLLAVTRDLLLPRLISGAIDLGDADVSRPELAA